VSYEMTCPRCGRDFSGDGPDVITDAVITHAATITAHALGRDVVRAHLAGVHPHDYED